MKKILAGILLSFSLLASRGILAADVDPAVMNHFIKKMASSHQFDQESLRQLLQSAEIKDGILKAISSPAEALPWYKYRNIFLSDARASEGAKFWQENARTLAAVEQQYGVPPAIIVAILGVETRYGKHTGHHRVIDALATLGFAYPKRSSFFLGELENFLLLCREEQLDPLQPTGSYAGAMGMPQFMPSSFRSYAVDFDGDKRRDIWDNPADVIASIGNYFHRHQWRRDQPIAYPASITGDAYKTALTKGLKPDLTIRELKSLNVVSAVTLDDDLPARLLQYSNEDGDEYWLGLHNFYVITRYNHSALYAMAVYQLSQEIEKQKTQLESTVTEL